MADDVSCPTCNHPFVMTDIQFERWLAAVPLVDPEADRRAMEACLTEHRRALELSWGTPIPKAWSDDWRKGWQAGLAYARSDPAGGSVTTERQSTCRTCGAPIIHRTEPVFVHSTPDYWTTESTSTYDRSEVDRLAAHVAALTVTLQAVASGPHDYVVDGFVGHGENCRACRASAVLAENET